MSGDARRRATRKWKRDRSPHANVLEGLELAIAQHPAGGRSLKRQSGPQAVTRLPRDDEPDGSDGPDAA